MELWDRDLEQRVWRRVRGGLTAEEDLTRLVRLSQAQVADLKGLDFALYRQEQGSLAILAGLLELSGGRRPEPVRTAPLSRQQRLKRCLSRCREQLQLMTILERHERYGPLFTDLIRRQRVNCARLEQLARIRPGSRF